uniref:Stabilin 2 n=1 Tax=Varanus komodoensis TaxID=61221 RepID=A0A8D2LAL5_VARKO
MVLYFNYCFSLLLLISLLFSCHCCFTLPYESSSFGNTIVTTKTTCRSCSLNSDIQCPEGYTKITNGSGIRDCRYYIEIRKFTLSLPGCRHKCLKEFQQPQCCLGYWGPDCLECPGGATSPCNNKGHCFQGMTGDGTCVCQVHTCYFPKTAFITGLGKLCSFFLAECSCVHGTCNSGIAGDGKCTCLSGYKGPSCDQPIPECQALQCPEYSRCSLSSADGKQLECQCLPNYEGDGKQCEPINPCSKNVCDPHADCLYLGPNRHKCTCQFGYRGDGEVCMPIDPCQTKFGNCPTESTVCKYDGPGKSHCECKKHFTNFVPGLGCSMTDICATNNPCHKYAECTMEAPGHTLCTCQRGYVGDGFICYGNIMEQIRDMNTKPGGQWQGKLISAIELFESAYEWPLNSLGPFTVLVPTNPGFKGINIKDLLSNKESAQYFVKLHIFAGQLDLNGLNHMTTIHTLTGKPADVINDEKDKMLRIRIQGGKKKGKILQADIVASNGVMHIVDEALDNVEPSFPSDEEVRFKLAAVNASRHFWQPTPTVVQKHRSIMTGQILVNGQPLEETDILAKNGRIYTLSGVLIPPSITPILPHRCDEEKIKITMVRLLRTVRERVPFSRSRCIYQDQIYPKYGCAKHCLVISQVLKCCNGFFGPDCNQCPGGFSKPCSGNGQCMDGMNGNGTCVCNHGFEGSRCQFCSDHNKYGPQCDNKCKCVYGVCDNQIDSDGACLPGSCKSGYTGKSCDSQVFPCGAFLQFCHAHADCKLHNATAASPPQPGSLLSRAECVKTGPGTHICVCQPGWTGNGRDCSEIHNCFLPNFGGCHSNATCLYIGPGQNDCECKEGFRGNGYECEPIDSCLGHSEKCHPLAVCQFTSSGVWDCVCSKGYEGDGRMCYGNAVEELSYLPEAAGFNEWMTAAIKTLLTDRTNLTILVPSRQAIQSMDRDERAFWMSENNMLTLTNCDQKTAKIVAGDIAATNGIIHVINKVLTPLRGISGTLPKLLPRLEQMPDYSIFRGYIIHYKLAAEIEAASAYTIFAPNNDAIENFLKNKELTSMEEDHIRYHVILEEKLLKNDMHNGMFRETMLGLSFRVGFSFHDLYINEAPINYPNVATDKGIIHGLGRVMEIEKNRCDSNVTVIVSVSCALTPFPCLCLWKKQVCFYLHYYRMSLHAGCQPKCSKSVITRECCAGFYGPQCEPCPGLVGKACFENGICLDGINGTGSCECEAGFQGVACNSCIQGKYSSNCDQDCLCIHGKCNSGITGDGTCDCDVGWRGVRCDNRKCGYYPSSELCFLNPGGAAYCKCAAGFQGNGTYCTAINACEANNGGCSAKAECRRTTPGNRVCVCKAGYTGDGIVCFQINPCLQNNGGCDKNAECAHTGPNQVNCLDFIILILSKQNNGGCADYAICNDTENSERTCTCRPSYVGDGFSCRGSITLTNGKTRTILWEKLYAVPLLTCFIFWLSSKVKDWVSRGVMAQILRYHVVACTGLLYNDMISNTEKSATTLQGDQLKFTFSQNTVFLNGKAKILTSDLISTNGVIHIIDKVLIPQRIQEFSAGQSTPETLKMVAAQNGYIMFYNLLESSGTINVINDALHQPITLFWPTDKVIRALPNDQQDALFKMSNKEKLQQYLKYHIIGSTKVFAYALPSSDSLKTLQGSDISVKCGSDDSNIGELFLNERRCKIIQRQLEFDGGIAYGIDCMLTDPVLGGRCDTFITSNIPVSPEEVKQCTYTLNHRILKGCQKDCSLVVRIPQCCKGYFGNECQGCPGGPEAPCNNRGSCDEGYSGTGQCTCNAGFNGTACELCLPGRYGDDCKACECTEHGQCDDGISASGQCFCETGWTGQLCETKLAVSPVCTPSCSINAVCQEQNTCQCKPYYTGDGITCTAENLCKKANGGCHKNAKCVQTDVKVNCTCQKGYQGDGYACTAINPCTDGVNGGCDEHALCTMTGPDKRKCECKDNYIGDGVICEVKQLPMDRCLQNNGQCHADAICTDLHYQDSTVGVFHVRSPKGQYKLTYNDANKTCADQGATIATYNQLLYAQMAKFHLCAAGWLETGRVAYPTAFSAPKCGGGVVGIIDYGIRVNLSETWDVFCYRVKDVSCTCKTGYVGDGFTCSGNLLQVLMSFPTFSNFVLKYSNASRNGQEFLKYLKNLSTNATLFVPNNDGLMANETLSGRDIEYHLSHVGTSYYQDLTNGTTLPTRIGKMLLITHNENQDQPNFSDKKMGTKYVDGRTILEWDIVASNGVIHVIAEPLKAPPLPSASLHPGVGTGIFFVVLLVIGIAALAGYSYFRFKQGTIPFQHFEEKDDIDVTMDKAQSSNIANPNYESSGTMPSDPPYDPFSVSSCFEWFTF